MEHMASDRLSDWTCEGCSLSATIYSIEQELVYLKKNMDLIKRKRRTLLANAQKLESACQDENDDGDQEAKDDDLLKRHSSEGDEECKDTRVTALKMRKEALKMEDLLRVDVRKLLELEEDLKTVQYTLKHDPEEPLVRMSFCCLITKISN